MDEQLSRLVTELHEAVARSQADGRIDDAERDELRTLIDQIQGILDEPSRHEGAVDQLEAAAVRFEGDHPTIAAVIRSAVDTLSGYGI